MTSSIKVIGESTTKGSTDFYSRAWVLGNNYWNMLPITSVHTAMVGNIILQLVIYPQDLSSNYHISKFLVARAYNFMMFPQANLL